MKALNPTGGVTGLELLQVADHVQRGTATAQDAARIRRAADLLAFGLYLPGCVPGIQRIAHERMRHISDEGYTATGDTGRGDLLAAAGACYALPMTEQRRIDPIIFGGAPEGWPFAKNAWKPSKPRFAGEDCIPYLAPGDRIRELEKAGALIAAAIDALLQEAAAGDEGGAA